MNPERDAMPPGCPPSLAAPSLAALFFAFQSIGLQSFGGGLSAWMRREIVQKRGWIDDRRFLTGLALAQITPGANAVNLAVFIGTTLRGAAGALAAFAGVMALPLVLILAAGSLLLSAGRNVPMLDSALAGLGAAAIGLTLATGWRMARAHVRSPAPALLIALTALLIGGLRWNLALVLAVVLPISLILIRLALFRLARR